MIEAALAWISNLSVAQTLRHSPGLLLPIRLIHFVSVMFVVCSIAKVDLRLLNLADKRTPVTEMVAEILPWTLCSFAITAATGLFLFVSRAPDFYANSAFRLKMLVIFLALINAALFHKFTYRSVAFWDENAPTPFAAKFAGAFSLVCWIAAAAYGIGSTAVTAGH